MRKSLVISVMALLMFGLMGFGFAMWADTVTVSASVETGDVAIGIRDIGTDDNIQTSLILGGEIEVSDDGLPDANVGGQPGGDPQAAVQGVSNEEGKNVAVCTSTDGDTLAFTLGDGSEAVNYYESISESITNAYPYYSPTTKFEIASNGSIPVKIDAFNVVDNLSDGSDLTGVTFDWTVTESSDGSSNTGTGLEALRDYLFGIQLHKGDVVTVELTTTFQQEANMNAEADYTITVHAAQWNEYGVTPDGIWSDLPEA